MASWAIAAVCAPAVPVVGGEIRIWPTAAVSSDQITVGDIAELRGFDAPAAERLRCLVVSAAPREGGQIPVQAGDVQGALAEGHVNLADVVFVGTSRCTVSRPKAPREQLATVHSGARHAPMTSPTRRGKSIQKVVGKATAKTEAPAPSTLESELREFISARTGEQEGKIEIRFSPTCRRELELDAAGLKVDIRQRDDAKLGLLTFEVTMASAGQATRTLPVVAEVAVVKDVVVAKRAINRGETIEGRNLKLEQRRFTDYSQIGITDLAAVVGQQARQMIRTGEMLGVRSMECKPLVRRGDPVTIWMRQGGLVIKAAGRAQEAGSLGQKIEVARDGMKRKQDLIEAVVTGPATVTVGETTQVTMAAGA